MPKRKESKAEEYHLGKIRELQKENRQLRQRIKQLEKYENMLDKPLSSRYSDKTTSMKKLFCPICTKGELKTFNALGKYYEECTICDYRKKKTT